MRIEPKPSLIILPFCGNNRLHGNTEGQAGEMYVSGVCVWSEIFLPAVLHEKALFNTNKTGCPAECFVNINVYMAVRLAKTSECIYSDASANE